LYAKIFHGIKSVLKREDSRRHIFDEKLIRSGMPKKEALTMSRHQSIMSEALKEEIAKELGVYNKVSAEGWGSVSSRDCGSMVKKAIEMAERSVNR